MKINIDKFQLSDIYNLKFKVFYPLTKFVSKIQFVNICNRMEVEKNTFFPIPLYFSLKTSIKKIKKIKIYFKGIYVCELDIKEVYSFPLRQKKTIGYKIFGTKDIKHPGLKRFLFDTKFFLDCNIVNFKFTKNLIQFSDPSKLIKKLNKKNIKYLVGFHTRNVPHKAHQWIHQYGLKKVKNLLIHPLIGQYLKGEYKESVLIKTNRFLAEKIYNRKKVFFATLCSYPRYAGPKEALLHSIIRKNYGCSHFLIGRDHAGIGKFYGKYESQQICKRFEKKIGIKIIAFKEPYLCSGCNKIINKKCKKCDVERKFKINGTFIRKLLHDKKKIPTNVMDKKIIKLISYRSIIA